MNALAAEVALDNPRSRAAGALSRPCGSGLLDQAWELVNLSYQTERSPKAEAVSFDHVGTLVLELVTARWCLRGCALCIAVAPSDRYVRAMVLRYIRLRSA
jgi:hypothetical protein